MSIQHKQKEYDELINRILTSKESVVKGQEAIWYGLYDIGLDLNKIKVRELYLLEWRSFDEFLEKKVDISKRTSFRSMVIAEEFTRVQFKDWGIKKLDIIQAALPNTEDRKEFMKLATSGIETKPLLEQLERFKIEKDIKETKRFSKQVGIRPRHSNEEMEHILKLQREAAKLEEQYNQIQAFKATFKESCLSWLKAAEKYPNLADLRHRIEVLYE